MYSSQKMQFKVTRKYVNFEDVQSDKWYIVNAQISLIAEYKDKLSAYLDMKKINEFDKKGMVNAAKYYMLEGKELLSGIYVLNINGQKVLVSGNVLDSALRII